MKKLFWIIGIALFIQSCDITTEERTSVPGKSASDEQVSAVKEEVDKMVLMHSRQGIRIEYNITRQKLILWVSPKAGESVDYFDRNFSNRDDHTSIFDDISFPELKTEDFVKCDYDPFYSVLHFKDQKLHVASIFDKPYVIVWLEKPGYVDFKTDKEDKAYTRERSKFIVTHPDRGYDFNFAAVLSDSASWFQHQLQIGKGRSIYARAHLSENASMYIAADLKDNYLPYKIDQVVNTPVQDHIAATKAKVEKIASAGKVNLKNDDELQKLIDINKHIYISMQDESGAIRAAIKSIYYLIWVRDGGMSSAMLGYSGWTETLEKWTRFQLANPTVVTNEEPTGRFFGQLVNKNITKWEEDGPFYAIWSAFAHWTQTGDKEFVDWKHLALMKESMDWLERYCYDDDKKAFGRYHYCETPLTGSRGNGWDNAVGNPTTERLTKYNEQVITRSYDIYINLLAYTTYRMLAAMTYQPDNQEYLAKAKELEPFIQSLYNGNDLPDYGLLQTQDGKEITAGPYGMDKTDYIWALSLPHFYPDGMNIDSVRLKLFNNMVEKPERYFFAGYFALLSSLDIKDFNQDSIMGAIQYAAKQSYRPGKYLPMAYTMVEMSDIVDGDKYHDIRPQGFTIGTWLGTMANLGIRRLPFGFAVRASRHLENIENYEYQGTRINIKYNGEGNIKSVSLNELELAHSLQVPDAYLDENKNLLTVSMEQGAELENTLVGSNVRLRDLVEQEGSIVFQVTGYGQNELMFSTLSKKVSVFDAYNQEVEAEVNKEGDVGMVKFAGFGNYRVVLE